MTQYENAAGDRVKRWRRTVVRVERREVTVFRPRNGLTVNGNAVCKVCGEHSAMIRGEDAAAAFGVDLAQVSRWLEEGRVHGHVNGRGQLMICAGSFRHST